MLNTFLSKIPLPCAHGALLLGLGLSIGFSSAWAFNSELVGGKAALETVHWPDQNRSDLTQNQVKISGQIEWRVLLSQSTRLQFTPLVLTDPLNESSNEQFIFEPEELSIEWRQSVRRFKLGYTKSQWEGTDFFNPMDLVDSENYHNPVNPLTRGSPGLYYTDVIEPMAFDLVYIPWQTRSLLPGNNSPWWPRKFLLPTQDDDLVLLLPEKVDYKILSNEELNKARRHNLALRLRYYSTSFDVSLAAFEGQSATPLLLPRITTTPIELSPKRVFQLESPIEIQPLYYRHRSFAGVITYPAGSWIFRLASQYEQPLGSDPRLPGWSHTSVLGLERTLFIKGDRLTLLTQYIHTEDSSNDSLAALDALTQQAFAFGVRYAFSEKWVWFLGGLQELTNNSLFTSSQLTYEMKDNVQLNLGAQVFSGRSGSALGTYKKNNQLTLGTSFLF